MLLDGLTGTVVLHEALGLLTDEVLGGIVDAILRQLLLGKDEGGGVDVLFLDLDAQVLSQMVLHELPTQLLEHVLGLLFTDLDVLLLVLLAAQLQEALQELLGQLHVTSLVGEDALGIDGETVVALGNVGALNHLAHGLAEGLLVLDVGVGAQDALEELLVHLGLLVDLDFLDGDAEVALHLGSHVAVNVEQALQLGSIAVVGLVGVEHKGVTHLDADKLGSLVLIVHVAGRNHGALHLDAVGLVVALLVELDHRAAQHRLLVAHLAVDEGAQALAVVCNGVIDHLVGNNDIVVRHIDALVELELDGGSQTQVILEGHLLVLHDVHLGVLVGKGLTQHLQLVLTDVVIDGIAHLAVNNIGGNAGTVEFHQQALGGLAGAETLQRMAHTHGSDFLVHVAGKIFSFKLDGEQSVHRINLFKIYVHYLVCILCLMFSSLKSGCKGTTFQPIRKI